MYLNFFSFADKPFDITPDSRFLYFSPQHEALIDTFLYGIQERRGFLLLTGEVGTGKTTSIRTLLNRLEPHQVESALIINPLLSTRDLLKAINTDFGVETPTTATREDSLHDQIAALNSFLLLRAREKKNAVVIIDEAQDLSLEALEMVRLLSNLETETSKLLQIILVGQPELEAKLEKENLRQLRQRIQVRFKLSPLDFKSMKGYVLHRLKIASPRCCLVFQNRAFKRIYEYTQGVPRLVNHLCELSLMAAYVQDTHIITPRVVEAAFADMSHKRHSKFASFLPWRNHVSSS